VGFLAGLLATSLLIVFVVSYLTSSDERSETHRAFAAAPVMFTLGLVGVLGFVGFFLGILIHPLGKFRIGVEGLALPLWQACGIVAALCVVFHMFLEDRR